MATTKPKIYRDMIDELVDVCQKGQGQIGAERVRDGIWNPNATADNLSHHPELVPRPD